jgi:hypothetical protein
MSWLFSQALVVEYSEDCSSDGEQFAPSSLTSTPAMFLLQGKTTEASNLSRYGMMCQPLTESLGAALLMWYLGASRARILAAQETEKELMVNEVGFGPRCSESLARYSPDSASWRTAQCSLFGGLEEFSETWPAWGMMQNGELLEEKPWVGITSGKEFGLWPTIVKNEGPGSMCLKLTDAIAMDEGYAPRYYQCDGMQGRALFTGKVNPEWAEWLMGWPQEWTNVLSESATDKFHVWLQRHGMSCAKKLGRKKNNMVVCKTSYNSAMLQGLKPHAGNTGTSA